MNAVLAAALGSIVRAGLAILAGYLVRAGIWTGSEATSYVMTGSLAVLAIGWSLWEKYRSRVQFLTALQMKSGTTENDVKAHIAAGAVTPSVLTPPDTAPGIPK